MGVNHTVVKNKPIINTMSTILSLLLISICIASSLAQSSVSDALSTQSNDESSLLKSITNLFGESRLIRRLQYDYYYTYCNGGDGEDGEDGEDGDDDDEGNSGSASGESGESGASGESGSESGGDDDGEDGEDGEDGDVAYYSNNGGGGYNYYQFYGEVDDEFVDEDNLVKSSATAISYNALIGVGAAFVAFIIA